METRKVSRGDRNCNPLNLIKSNNDWIGKVESDDSRFEKFLTHYLGYRAAYICLKKHYSSGCNTLSSLIAKWAPETENKTSEYIHFVSKFSGIYPSEIFGWNYNNVLNIMKSMSIYENGYCPNENALKEALSNYCIGRYSNLYIVK